MSSHYEYGIQYTADYRHPELVKAFEYAAADENGPLKMRVATLRQWAYHHHQWHRLWDGDFVYMCWATDANYDDVDNPPVPLPEEMLAR